MRARFKEAYALAALAFLCPEAAFAQSMGCGAGGGFSLSNLMNVLEYIAGVMSGPLAKVIIIIGVVSTILFIIFSGDNVSNVVKTVVGIIVGVVFLFALISWITGYGTSNSCQA
jgi:type IV secretory pathway VirB2 component (pilin)